MDDFNRLLVAGVSVTAARASSILTVNRDKKRQIFPSISSKDIKYRADIIAARILLDTISK